MEKLKRIARYKYTPKLIKRLINDFLLVSNTGKVFVILISLFSLITFIELIVNFPLTLLIILPFWVWYENI